MNWSPLQKREIFHLEFLRELVVKVPSSSIILKGGSNLRFFFGSDRYSEDMDLDADGLPIFTLRDKVMAILRSKTLAGRLRTFGIEELVPPDLASAKQTETVQRFKIHLLTAAKENLFTKVEFSRRGFDSPAGPEAVDASVVSRYLIPPLIVPHYLAEAAIRQKIRALGARAQPQARDIFDLYILSARPFPESKSPSLDADRGKADEARRRIFEVDYNRFRDTVVAYLDAQSQERYSQASVWDEIRLTAASIIERMAGLERKNSD